MDTQAHEANRRVPRFVPLCSLLCVLVGCHSIGHRFSSDQKTLSKLVIGKTTPEEARAILGGDPYIRQNLPNGTIAWHWQSIVAGAYVGLTDNRLLILQFEKVDGAKGWRFQRVLHAQNVDLPDGMPFGSVVK
jgi:hypothetical protein